MKIVGKSKWEKENKIGKRELSCGYQLLVVVKINISIPCTFAANKGIS